MKTNNPSVATNEDYGPGGAIFSFGSRLRLKDTKHLFATNHVNNPGGATFFV